MFIQVDKQSYCGLFKFKTKKIRRVQVYPDNENSVSKIILQEEESKIENSDDWMEQYQN